MVAEGAGCSWKGPESKEGILERAKARKQVTVVKGGTIFTTKTKKGVVEDGKEAAATKE